MQPRLTIAGLSGDSGKTFISCGLLSAFSKRRLKTVAFKKGPDYIDPAWLSLASGTKARNLDTYLMDRDIILNSFINNSRESDIALIEGNRGLFDGFDAKGTHSTAELAKLLESPVILIINIVKMTRTAAVLVLGSKLLDTELNIGGVILNLSAGSRHEKIAAQAIEETTGIPVLGAIPKLNDVTFPSRHLGLITPGEYKLAESAIEESGKIVEDYINVDEIIAISRSAPELTIQEPSGIGHPASSIEHPASRIEQQPTNYEQRPRIGYFYDRAFSFYYPENLEALEKSGAELVQISSIDERSLPDIDGLYIGGGFPESNVEELTSNNQMLKAVKKAAEEGMPIYAECGGLIYLADSLDFGTYQYDLAGVFPVKIKMNQKPQGHGYMDVTVDKDNPYFAKGTNIKGHEFHYTSISGITAESQTCLSVTRGSGAIDGRDGLLYKNTFGTYLHIHALSAPEWAENFTSLARRWKEEIMNYEL